MPITKPEAASEETLSLATAPTYRARRVLKHDRTFAVLDSNGDIGVSTSETDGIFHNDTRYLSRLGVLLAGQNLLLLGSNARHDNSILSVDLTNPDIYDKGMLRLEKDILHFHRTIFLSENELHQRIAISNFGDRDLELDLTFVFGADFADIFEVRGARRPMRGMLTHELLSDRVRFAYLGLDDKLRRTELYFEPRPAQFAQHYCRYRWLAKAGTMQPMFCAVRCDGPHNPETKSRPFLSALLTAHRANRRKVRGIATIETSNDIFNEMLSRSVADLYMLNSRLSEGIYPFAGVPWFSTVFGRDGLITALQTLWMDPRIARGVLNLLAANQAKSIDAAADAEPGKILHETREGEMATLGEVPFGRYYGSVDSTPLFVLLAGLYFERTGDKATIQRLWPAVLAAIEWMDQYGDSDTDGFLEYRRKSEIGLANQGWKDSHDSIFHRGGELARGPIALAEVQGYAYAAKKTISRVARRLGADEWADRVEYQAENLREQFESAFWCDDLQTYAIALDGEKRQCRVRSSNAGQLLMSGIVSQKRADLLAVELMQPHFFSGWGIRTLAKGEPRFNPMSYHNGSIWPHDNSLIAMGLAAYGHKKAAGRIFKALFDAASHMESRRLPELFCGFRRRPSAAPTLYPVACSPQAWASGTPFLLLQSCLGMKIDPFAATVRFESPVMPIFIDKLAIRDLEVGDARVDLEIERNDSHELSVRSGPMNKKVTVQIS